MKEAKKIPMDSWVGMFYGAHLIHLVIAGDSLTLKSVVTNY